MVCEPSDAVIEPEHVVWVVVGDRRQIEPRIRELEFGELTLLNADGEVLAPAVGD